MKKLSFLFALLFCFSLCACRLGVAEAPPAALDVQITAGQIEAGMTAKDVFVEVTVDGQPVACEVELTRFTEDGYYVMEEDEPAPEAFYGRLDVYYSLPEGADLDGINVTMECDGGEYDGTGGVSDDADGCVVAWSHAIYGSEPEPETEPETEPITEPETEPATEPVTEPETKPATKPETKPETKPATKPETEPVTEPATEPEQPHTHNWEEDVSKSGMAGCTVDGYKTYVCDCGETQRETIPATGHDIKTDSTTEPTCTREGYQSMSCKRCGVLFLYETPATGHSWSGWYYENGRLHKRTCSVCHAEEEANHNIPSGTVKCTDCGEDIVN